MHRRARRQLRRARRAARAAGDVLDALALTLLYFIAIFAVFSYIGPVLQALVPMSGERLSVTLALFGLSGVVGTLIGGAANDRFGSRRTLPVQLVGAGRDDGRCCR